ncbi:hypothetical protein DL98DRAFT_599839 [Cadophora sp. DSE1049]|nr:hypothetical protein DL98DRAFT_599839 [Cadophora sp. DSE1049]
MSVNTILVNDAILSTSTRSTSIMLPVECPPVLKVISNSLEETHSLLNTGTVDDNSDQGDMVVISGNARGLVQLTNTSNAMNINDLPTEILIEIFKHVRGYHWFQRWSICSMTCLGLSSSRLYHVMKLIHPGPICSRAGADNTDSNGKTWAYTLQAYIGDFLGPAYRFRVHDPRFSRPWHGNDIPFLRRDIYGDSYGEEEKALNDRFYDWKTFSTRFGISLPHPFGMGKSWHEVVFDSVSRIAELSYRRKYDGPNEWGGASADSMVTQYLGGFYTYKWMNFRYEVKYDFFREGALMLGL